MSENEIISAVLGFIKKQAGLSLNVCSHFAGLQLHKEMVFFNVEIESPCFDSSELKILTRLSGDRKLISSVEPNGHKRIAIFIKPALIKAI